VSASRWLAASGADPRKVALLAKAIDADGKGRWKDAEQRMMSGGKVKLQFAPGLLQMLMVLGAALFSLFFAGLLVMIDQRTPMVGVIITLFGGIAAGGATWLHGVELLLADDDDPVVGHWPVSARDVGVARLSILFRRSLPVVFALTLVPSLVATFLFQPYALAGIVIFVASMLQGVLVTTLFAAVLFTLGRAVGKQKAQRIGSIVTIVLLLLLSQAANFGAARVPEVMPAWVETVAPFVSVIPPFTFVAWPAFFAMEAGPSLALGAGGLVVLALLLRGTVNLIAPRGVAQRGEAPTSRRHERSTWIETLLRPWLPGSEAKVVRLLTVAHLREDRHFLLSVALLPIQALIMTSAWVFREGPSVLVADGEGFRVFHAAALFAAMMGFHVTVMASRSGLRNASWLVASSPAAHAGWAAWQRGLTRALDLPVLVPLFFVLHVAASSSPWLVLDDLLLLVALHEAGLWTGQWVLSSTPFSSPPKSLDGNVIGASLLLSITVFPVLGFWLALVHGPHPWAKPITLLVLASVVWLARSRTARRDLVFA